MPNDKTVVIGGGVGGLCAAIALAGQGVEVEVLERAPKPGGKLREVSVGDAAIDGGPTVFTMRWVFEELFAQAGLSFEAALDLEQAGILARHAWDDSGTFDLHADVGRSIESVGDFAGAEEARRFEHFCASARRAYETLEEPFLRASRPNLLTFPMQASAIGLLRSRPFSTLWRALGAELQDPRLIQLFGRYATYVGSSPFAAPATMMLIAHVEQKGVWFVRGGMYRLIEALKVAAETLGVVIRCNTHVSDIMINNGAVSGVRTRDGDEVRCKAVVFNGDAAALSTGMLGRETAKHTSRRASVQRSLSAMVWTMTAKTSGLPLHHHTVLFSRDYKSEFDALFDAGRVPGEPTVYICAQDRGDAGLADSEKPERLLCLINAPANGDIHAYSETEISQCLTRMTNQLERCGLNLEPQTSVVTTPSDFAKLFPATGGALYGEATHGWMSVFRRPDVQTRVKGLYRAGGSVHPGPGVPMAALSGRMAAHCALADFTSTQA